MTIQMQDRRVLTIGNPGLEIVSGKGQDAANWWEAGGATGGYFACQPIGAASLLASYTDLTGNGNDVGLGVAPTWDGVSWIFNGATQFLTTTFVPDNDQSQTILVRYSGLNIAVNGVIIGMHDAANRACWIQGSNGGVGVRRYVNGTTVGTTGVAVAVAGIIGLAGNQGYWNGVAEAGAMPGYGAIPATSLEIGRLNAGAGLWVPVSIQAVVAYDNDIGAPAVAAVTTRMAAL